MAQVNITRVGDVPAPTNQVNITRVGDVPEQVTDSNPVPEPAAAITPVEASEEEGTTSEVEEKSYVEDSVFYSNIGKHAESDHGNVPVDTKDAKESNSKIKTKDLGYGHKVKPSEDESGMIHGIKFKNEDGSYTELTEEQKVTILNKDMASELSIARKKGWDSKLKAIGTTWDDLETPYKQALTSLAYNTGGSVAGGEFTAVLKAAKDKDVKEFAKQLRRNDNGKKTAGMDNRVAKELFYSGLIKSFSEVSKELPLGKASVAGIPK